MYEIFEELLKQSGSKAADVARATGISQTVFSEWKKGKSSPKADKIQLIADYFGVSVDYLLGAKKRKPTTYDDIITVYTRGKNNLSKEEKMRLARIILEDEDD